MLIRIAKLTLLQALFLACSMNIAYASRATFDTVFFKELDQLVIYTHVYSTTDSTATRYLYNQESISSPLSRGEIEDAVISSFKSQFLDYGIEVFSRHEIQEEEKKNKLKSAEKLQSTDPFSPMPSPEKNRAQVHVFIVLQNNSTDNNSSYVYGSISSKIVRHIEGRFKQGSDMILEAFPQPFILSEEKSKAVEVIKEKTTGAFKMERRWILCKKHQEIKCYNESSGEQSE